MSIRAWIGLQRIAIVAWLAPIPLIALIDEPLWAIVWTILVMAAATVVFHPNRRWWTDDVRAHANDPNAMRLDRRGHFAVLGLVLLVLVLLPPLLTITGLYRSLF